MLSISGYLTTYRVLNTSGAFSERINLLQALIKRQLLAQRGLQRVTGQFPADGRRNLCRLIRLSSRQVERWRSSGRTETRHTTESVLLSHSLSVKKILTLLRKNRVRLEPNFTLNTKPTPTRDNHVPV